MYIFFNIVIPPVSRGPVKSQFGAHELAMTTLFRIFKTSSLVSNVIKILLANYFSLSLSLFPH